MELAGKEKKLNKRLVDFVIGGTILGISGITTHDKKRGIIGRFLYRIQGIWHKFRGGAKHLGEKIGK